MSPWWALLPLTLVMAAGAWTSYRPEWKSSPSFVWVMVALCALNGVLWAWAVRRSANDRETYSLAVAWDVITIAAYNLLPLIACGVRLSWTAAGGMVLVVAGACLVKWG
jgi:hypothetical protein